MHEAWCRFTAVWPAQLWYLFGLDVSLMIVVLVGTSAGKLPSAVDLQRNISLCSCSSVIVIFQISTEIHFHHISVMSSITAGFLGMKIFCSNPGHNINFNLFQSPAQVLAHRLWATDALSGALSPVQIHKHQPSPVSSRLSWSACYKDLRSTIAGLCLVLTCQNVIMMMMP